MLHVKLKLRQVEFMSITKNLLGLSQIPFCATMKMVQFLLKLIVIYNEISKEPLISYIFIVSPKLYPIVYLFPLILFPIIKTLMPYARIEP